MPTLVDGVRFEDALWVSEATRVAGWTSARGLAVPASGRHLPTFAVAAEASAARGWPIAVRRTGGGCVPQGKGILNLCWQVAESGLTIDEAYARFAEAVTLTLAAFGVKIERQTPKGAWCPGDYDLSAHGRKLVGISQRRFVGPRSRRAFVHGALFLDPDLDASFSAMATFLNDAGASDVPTRAAATSVAEVRGAAVAAGEAATVLLKLRAALLA